MRNTQFVLVITFLSFYNWSLSQFDTSHMIDSLRQVIAQSQEDTNKVSAMLEIARYYALTDIQEAIRVMDEGKQLSEKIHYSKGLRACHGMKGMLLTNLGDFEQSIEELDISLQLAIDAKDQIDIARASGTLGSIMQMQGRFPEALDYNFKALKASESGNDSTSIAACLSNIGSIYQEIEDYEEALIWLVLTP